MQIGKLRHRIELQELVPGSPAQDAGGAPDESWVLFAAVYADVSPLRGRELIAAQQLNTEVTGTIKIRYRTGVTSKMRAVFEGRNYDILGVVDPSERHRELLLYVKEGPNSG